MQVGRASLPHRICFAVATSFMLWAPHTRADTDVACSTSGNPLREDELSLLSLSTEVFVRSKRSQMYPLPVAVDSSHGASKEEAPSAAGTVLPALTPEENRIHQDRELNSQRPSKTEVYDGQTHVDIELSVPLAPFFVFIPLMVLLGVAMWCLLNQHSSMTQKGSAQADCAEAADLQQKIENSFLFKLLPTKRQPLFPDISNGKGCKGAFDENIKQKEVDGYADDASDVGSDCPHADIRGDASGEDEPECEMWECDVDACKKPAK